MFQTVEEVRAAIQYLEVQMADLIDELLEEHYDIWDDMSVSYYSGLPNQLVSLVLFNYVL